MEMLFKPLPYTLNIIDSYIIHSKWSFFRKKKKSQYVIAHRCQHVDIIAEVSHKCDDAHSLSETFNLAEEQHEAVLLSQLIQRSSLPLILTHEFALGLSG